MKRAPVMGILTVGLLVASSSVGSGQWTAGTASRAWAPSVLAAGQQQAQQPPASRQPSPGSQQSATEAQTRLGTIRLPRNVMADGKPLAAGSYQLRLTGEQASPVPPGQTPGAERWVEFLRGGKVVGRELATVVPDSEIAQIAEGHGRPARNGQRVDLLKSQKYWRVWVHRGGNHYLIHLPPA